eukprot:TRINITY_DN12379_c6_g1_i1.p1 TRINITY_DN12379_c6_g1~~TRINITY_DN12379_c6_g1_i1.p1  ORF type:complete len:288 (+),score=59.95 TRINITY_DN12379_c6_g1_i1:76-864(+)
MPIVFPSAGSTAGALVNITNLPPEWTQADVSAMVTNIAAVRSCVLPPATPGSMSLTAQIKVDSAEAAASVVVALNGAPVPGSISDRKLGCELASSAVPASQDPAEAKGGKGGFKGKGKGAADPRIAHLCGPKLVRGEGVAAVEGGVAMQYRMVGAADRGPRSAAENLPKALESLACIAEQLSYTGEELIARDPSQPVGVHRPPPGTMYNPRGGPWAQPQIAAQPAWMTIPCPFCAGPQQVEYTPGTPEQYQCPHCGGTFALE